MKVHITKIYGLIGTGAKMQEAVAAIAKRELHFDEIGIYHYPVETDTSDMLRIRVDGTLASVSREDIVIIQSPTWNDFKFDEHLMRSICKYHGVGKIIFVHDILPLKFESYEKLFQRYIEFYNRADLIIVASQNMAIFLRSHGVTVKKIVVSRMLDCVMSDDNMVRPSFKKVINLAGNPNNDSKLEFCKRWNYEGVQLALAVDGGAWAQKKNICFLGVFDNDEFLANAFRKNGGFGLLWSEDSYWRNYIKMSVPYELSVYLAAGLPVIVPSGIAEQDAVIRKNLGLVVDSLDEAVDRIEHMSEVEYQKMAENVELFSHLLRKGYFTKKALTDAVFKLLND